MKKLDYHTSVNYDIADPAKLLAQKQGLATATNMPFNFAEVEGTRGESAYVFDMGNMYGALVQEGLGSKSLIAQDVYKATGKSFFAAIAKDTVAAVINDLISVGATPVVLNAYWSSSSYDWLTDKKLTEDFIKGWRRACDESNVTWGGGETQSLSGIVAKGSLEFAGSAFGVIKPKKNLIQDDDLRAGDVIVFVQSNGVHANGISMAREVASALSKGYQTKLADGSTYGETLLRPTILYAKLVQTLLDRKVNLHYLSNITGHGWRKIMRGTPKFTYEIDKVQKPQIVFDFIGKHSGNDLKEMYSNYNMGVGYALFLPEKDVEGALDICKELKLKAWAAGRVEKGPKQVVIKPLNIIYSADTLELR